VRTPTTTRLVLPLVIALLSALCFLPALYGSFLNWDDNINFLDNPAYRGLGPDQLAWDVSSVLFGHYIPLTRVTWSINYALGGLEPWGYHLVNLVLHAANAALVYFVAQRLLSAAVDNGIPSPRDHYDLALSAAVAALVFGVHPLRVEPVAWISARSDLLCALFILVAVSSYLRAVEGTGPASFRQMVWPTLAFATALLSKGVALPLPAALFLLDIYPLRRFDRLGWRPLVREKTPLLLVMVAGVVVVVYALRHGAVLTQLSTYDASARLAAMVYACVMSPLRFVWPASLSPLYEIPARISLLEPRFGLALLVALLLTTLLIVLRRAWPAGLAAWTFSALMLAPVSAAVRQGADLAPDRYSYIAGLGFAMLVGGAALAMARLTRRGVLSRASAVLIGATATAGLAALAVTSWSYAEIWRDSETLWHWAVEMDPDCSVCHGKLGESALGGPDAARRAPQAEASFRRAIELRPDLPDAYFNLGTALVLQGRYAEAEGPLQVYVKRVPQAAVGFERLGLLYLLEKRYEAAVPLLRTALARRPDSPGLRGYLIEALEGNARDLIAGGRATEAEKLAAEARALRDGPRAEEATR
jgi:tetratricopeptide (TPR) repeat protein